MTAVYYLGHMSILLMLGEVPRTTPGVSKVKDQMYTPAIYQTCHTLHPPLDLCNTCHICYILRPSQAMPTTSVVVVVNTLNLSHVSFNSTPTYVRTMDLHNLASAPKPMELLHRTHYVLVLYTTVLHVCRHICMCLHVR